MPSNTLVYVNLLEVKYVTATNVEKKTFPSQDAVLQEVSRLLDTGYQLISNNGSQMVLRYDPKENRPQFVTKSGAVRDVWAD